MFKKNLKKKCFFDTNVKNQKACYNLFVDVTEGNGAVSLADLELGHCHGHGVGIETSQTQGSIWS